LAFTCRSHARALAAGLPRQDHVCIATDNLFRFHSSEFDEIPCKLDSTEFARSFRTKPNPTLINGSVDHRQINRQLPSNMRQINRQLPSNMRIHMPCPGFPYAKLNLFLWKKSLFQKEKELNFFFLAEEINLP